MLGGQTGGQAAIQAARRVVQLRDVQAVSYSVMTAVNSLC